MKKITHALRAGWKPLVGTLGFLVILVWTTGLFTTPIPSGTVAHEPGQPLPPDAVTLAVTRQHRPRLVEAVGSVASDNAVQLSARVSAYVQEVHVHAGDAVERDQILIRLDDRDLRAQLTAAQAILRRAETEFERIQRLHATQAATEQQLIAAESAFRAARSAVDQAEVALTFTEIRAPFAGRITDREVEVGMLTNPGQPLLHLYDPARMRLDVPVPVRLVDALVIGDAVALQLERPDTPQTGRVHRVIAAIDAHSRTQLVQVLLEPSDPPPLPGTFGRLWIPAAPRDVILVPRSAVYRTGQLEMVQVVAKQRVVRRLVKTGTVRDDEVEVLAGLSDGETILVEPIKW